ncbi:MAG TPA: DUF3862 domain-containing protein [Alicyclobacillus sp.]|nr:DUF3862 domain-containing protein [Alicyclobacillus sp.]
MDKKPLWKRWWVWALAVVVVIIVAASVSGGKNQSSNSSAQPQRQSQSQPQPQAQSQSSPQKQEAPKNSSKITKEEFDKIQTGMTYDQVVQIIGGPGELLSEAGDGEYKMQMYKWDGEKGFGSNANVSFQGGKVVAKAQLGLE